MNTIEGNKLIAEFMGIIMLPDMGVWFIENPDELKYDCSWDWLMPVVEKIEKEFCSEVEVKIYSSSCYIDKWNGKKWDSFISGVGNKKEAVYSAVIQFILWYNTQSK